MWIKDRPRLILLNSRAINYLYLYLYLYLYRCVLLLLNAFVLLKKVNHVDLMFADLLQEDFQT